MHELSICQALLDQVIDIARENNATSVQEVNIDVGPLSGVVPELLIQAFTLARADSMAAEAQLMINESSIIVQCAHCGHDSKATTNSLICTHCGDWRTTLLQGDELMLRDVVLELAPNQNNARMNYV